MSKAAVLGLLLGALLFERVSATTTVQNSRLPDLFGNFTSKDLKSAPPCGTELSSFNGIAAYSNGDNQGTGDSCQGWSATGLDYQCVEYTQRYFNSIYGVAPVWPVNFAFEMCSSYPAGVAPTSVAAAGFGVVFNWPPYGHTAVVTSVGDGVITVIEQNGSPSGENQYAMDQVLCYLSPGR